MKTHKFYFLMSTGDQFILCTGKKCNRKETGLSYFWRNVDCKKCKALKGVRRYHES